MAKLLLDQDWSAQPNEEHRDAWRYLESHAFAYPEGENVSPMKAGKESLRDGRWAGIQVVCDAGVPGNESVLSGAVVAHGYDSHIIEDGVWDCFPKRLADALFTHRYRGHAYACLDGGRRGLHLIFRRCSAAWMAEGYSLHPVAVGTYLKALTVRRGKHAWHLVDFLSLVGLEGDDARTVAETFAGPAFSDANDAVLACVAAGVFGVMVREQFGVNARLTAGRTAIAAVSRHIPDGQWLWKPSALAVTLSRVGGGFRGGYCYYPSYRGPGHKIDMRRAYSWALAQPLPYGDSYGRCVANGRERDGMYVCTVRGPGYYPAYLAPYTGREGGFRRRLWNGDECVCVLPMAEFAGLRALGYRVDPGWGVVYSGTVSLAGFVTQCDRLREQHGADTPQGLVGKALANRVYGKLAEHPTRQEMVFTEGEPEDDYLPFLDASGEEVENAWCYERTSYRNHQHIDIASVVTALVRSRLYDGMARLDAAGGTVLAVDTDGLVCTIPPQGVLAIDGAVSGSWRDCGFDRDVIIAGNRLARINGRAIAAGTPGVTGDVVELAYTAGVVAVGGKAMAPAWQPGPMTRETTRKLRRGA